MTTLRLGIDIGSTTIKFVVLDENAKIIYKNYERHFSETGNAFKRNLEKVAPVLGDNPFYITLSGSSGMGVASRLNLPFEQEVLSCTSAINLLAKDTETAIELGGEDAKITYLKGSLEQRMNGACAGGTGAFIDQMANSILSLLVVVSLLKLIFRHSSMMVLKKRILHSQFSRLSSIRL